MSSEKEMSFLDHLEELRWHVVRSLIAVLTLTIASFVAAPWIFRNIVFAPSKITFPTFQWLCKLGELVHMKEALCVEDFPFKVQSRLMTGQFTMHLTTSLVLGLVVAFPYVVWEIWRFVKPGLQPTERKYSKGAVFSISFMFFIGISFGYYIMAPMSIYFLANYSISDVIVNEFDITSYVGTITTLVLGSGLLFQLPIVVYFLSQVGIVTPQLLRHYRKHAIVVILIIAAILTPPDPLSQVLITFPLYTLYEFSIFISAFVVRRKKKQEARENLADQTN